MNPCVVEGPPEASVSSGVAGTERSAAICSGASLEARIGRLRENGDFAVLTRGLSRHDGVAAAEPCNRVGVVTARTTANAGRSMPALSPLRETL